MSKQHLCRTRFALLALLLQLAACGSSGTDEAPATDPEPTEPPPPATLDETLGRLGVDTSKTPRVDNNGGVYPESYAPLGAVVSVRHLADASEPDGTRYVVGRGEELLLVGYRPDGQTGVVSVIDDLTSGVESGIFTLSDTLLARTTGEAPWAIEQSTGGNSASGPPVVQGTNRDAVAGDFNGDGFRESAVVYYDASAAQVRLLVSDAMSPAPTEYDVAIPVSAAFFPLNDIRVISGDFDGDLKDELAIAVARIPDLAYPDTPVGLYIVDDADSGFMMTGELDLGIDTVLTSPHITMAMDDVRLDYDARNELVLVINENSPTGPSPGLFASQYFVIEDAPTGLAILLRGPVEADIGGATVPAVVADVAGGDLDGDSLDEIIFGGLEEVISRCSSEPSPYGFKHVMIALGNRANGFAQVNASTATIGIPNCDEANGFMLRFTHLNTLDFDGDNDDDIQLNTMIFDTFPGEDWNEAMLGEILDTDIMLGYQEQSRWFDRSNSAMAVSDQTGDARYDIVSLLLDEQQPYLNVWRCEPDPDTGKCNVGRATRVALRPGDMNPNGSFNPNAESNVNPIIIPVDVDNDDVTIYRFTEEHILDFTEPMVIAALAAAPCSDGIGQALDECTTTWGSASSTTLDRTYSIGVSGSISGGSGTAGAGVIAKSKHTLSLEASWEFSKSYELSRSLAFTTGPTEDSVVFIAIPIDRYGYEVISTPDPADLGATMYVDLPRSLIMLIATREYYNESVQPDALKIGRNVFDHVPGDLRTYPDARDKDRILEEQRSRVEDARLTLFDPLLSLFDPIEALGGLEVGPVSVGQGAGSTELALEYVEGQGHSNSLEVGYEYEAETAAGLLVGFTVGASVERSLSISHGDTTLYSGSIGSIDKDNFGANRYSYGLFAYIQAEQGQEFEVLNYWVELD